MPILRCQNGPFAGHIAFVREDCHRVELYDVNFLSSPLLEIIGMWLNAKPGLTRTTLPERTLAVKLTFPDGLTGPLKSRTAAIAPTGIASATTSATVRPRRSEQNRSPRMGPPFGINLPPPAT